MAMADPIAFDINDIETFFNCIDAAGLALVSAHRGGPVVGYPENALPTFERTVAAGIPLLEIDVATAADGVLFLHHDDTLDRTTTGTGVAANTTWDEIRQLSLRDPLGEVTAYGPNTLDEALAWADGKAILQLDIKRSTDYDDVRAAVEKAGATERVVVIAYTEGQAAALVRRFPNTMISATVMSMEDVDNLIAAGLREDQILAWTGTEAPSPLLYEELDARGIEVAFGTLGGSRSIDREIEATRNDARYASLVAEGIDMIATDRPFAAYEALALAGQAGPGAACAAPGTP